MPFRWPCGCPDRGLSTAAECCCSGCGNHFATPTSFDDHWKGVGDDRHCVDPATLVYGPASRRAGQPILKLVDRASGPVWVVSDDRPHPGLRARQKESERLSALPGIPGTPNGSHPPGGHHG